MPSSNPFPEQRIDPIAPMARFVHWLARATFDCALGVAIGTILARLMRSRHLHWSWAVAGLVLIVLAQPILGSATLTLAVAALWAAVHGRRWHREDIDAGSDLADLAARRRGPLDLLRRCARAAALRHRFRRRGTRGAKGRLGEQELILGSDDRCRAVSIPFGGRGGGMHTLVVGATGSGKTVTQTWMAVGAIERGMGAIVVDPKGDRGMRDEVRRAARTAGRPFAEWTPRRRLRLQPVRTGQRDRDRRQGPGWRALHGAPLPAPGSTLPRSRGAGSAQERCGGQPARHRASPGPRAAGGAPPDPARARGPGRHMPIWIR